MNYNLNDIDVVNTALKDLNALNIPLDKLKILYPNLLDKAIPLSKTGVHPRTYFDWKEKGLVEFEDREGAWIKLNLMDYCWIMVIAKLRQIGVSIKNLLKLKEDMLSSRNFTEMLKQAPEILKDLENNKFYSGKKFDALKNVFHLLVANLTDESIRQMKTYNQFASVLGNILITNDNTDLIGYLKEDGESLVFFAVTIGQTVIANQPSPEPYRLPRVVIPLRPIVESVFLNPSIVKYTYSMGFLTEEEREIIDLVREGDFKELIIKNEKEKKSILRVKEKNELNERATEIQKLLGMNEYDEVTVKFRNKKDLFIRNKRKIK